MIVNATAHPIHILDASGGVVATLEPSGGVARCSQSVEAAEPLDLDGVPIATSRTGYGAVEGLGPQAPGVWYVVSAIVKNASPRDDLLVPAEMVKDESGRPLGCRSLGR